MNITWDEVTIDHLLHFEKVLPLYDLVFPIEEESPMKFLFRACTMQIVESRIVFVF
jgi:hypothetical protein